MKFDIVRAWKDETYRQNLSDEQREALPANPAGELTEAEMALVYGSGGGGGYGGGGYGHAAPIVHHGYGHAAPIGHGGHGHAAPIGHGGHHHAAPVGHHGGHHHAAPIGHHGGGFTHGEHLVSTVGLTSSATASSFSESFRTHSFSGLVCDINLFSNNVEILSHLLINIANCQTQVCVNNN
jgi:mersacidin/lichenicidin family type 2 lantibiotic